MAQQENMALTTFQKKFETNEDCRKHLFKIRWPDGFLCPKCGHKHYNYLPKRKLYQCGACQHQTSVIAGTVFHSTKTSLRKWFLAIFLVSRDKRGISAAALAKLIRVNYSTAWLMLHKIRNSMKLQDAKYQLGGIIELDEGFFGKYKAKDKVVVEVALNQKGNPQFAKLKDVPVLNASIINQVAIETIRKGSEIKTDGHRVHNGLEYAGFQHTKVETFKQLHWLHILISNAKTFLKGTYHGACKSKHYQQYLDEFCYRFNRRFWDNQLFNRLLFAGASFNSITYKSLTAKPKKTSEYSQ